MGTRDSTSQVQSRDFDPIAQHRVRLQALDTQTLDWGSKQDTLHQGLC